MNSEPINIIALYNEGIALEKAGNIGEGEAKKEEARRLINKKRCSNLEP